MVEGGFPLQGILEQLILWIAPFFEVSLGEDHFGESIFLCFFP